MISSSIRITYGDLSLGDYSMYLYINGGVGLFLYICSKVKNFKFNKYEIIIFIMIIMSCLSLLSAIDVNVAIFGRMDRHEGLLVWLTYYILILNGMNIKNKKYLYTIISLIFVYMFANVFYGLYQVKVFSRPTLFRVNLAYHYARGFLGNFMSFGSLACICYGLILGVFIKMVIGLKKYFLAIILLIINLAIIMSGTMSSIVAVVVINVVILVEIIVLIIKKNKNRWIYLASFIIGVMSFVLVFLAYTNRHPSIKNDTLTTLNEAKSAIAGKVDDNYGTGRIYIWKNTIEKIKEAPVTGYGIDNFMDIFDGKLIDPTSKGIVDKAHNDYLQKALCEGVISGILFIVFLLIIFFKCIFKNLSPVYYGVFLAFTTYSVQAFFNISATRVAPIYFIIIGLLISILLKRQVNKEKVEIK